MAHNTIPNWFKKRASLTPNQTAIIFKDQAYTFQDMLHQSEKVAGQLASLQIAKDQFVAVLLHNHIDTVHILYALQMMGAKTVVLNTRLTADEIAWQLEDANPDLLITEESFKEVTDQLLTKNQNIRSLLKQELFALQPKDANLLEEFHLSDVTTIMYTSGTTGNPKGVLQTYGNHWSSAVGSALNLGVFDSDRWLCTLPIFHISGYSILMRGVIYGIPVVLHESFDETEAISAIKEHKITIMSAVTTMVARMVDVLQEDSLGSHFRCVLLGGGPCPLPLLQTCAQKGIPVIQTYGMTETASQTATLSPELSLKKIGSVGKPLFPVQVKIVGLEGEMTQAAREGEIMIKGPNVTIGYLNNDQATSEKLVDGWLKTGDIGFFDKEGFLYVLDRRSDLIISGGENIYPAEIEGILSEHHDIIEAGIIGIPDPKWGQVPVAFVVKKESSTITEEVILRFCQNKLAKYKIPKKVYFLEVLPRNASKKLLRKELRNLITQ